MDPLLTMLEECAYKGADSHRLPVEEGGSQEAESEELIEIILEAILKSMEPNGTTGHVGLKEVVFDYIETKSTQTVLYRLLSHEGHGVRLRALQIIGGATPFEF